MLSSLGILLLLQVNHRGAVGSVSLKSYSSTKYEMTTLASAAT